MNKTKLSTVLVTLMLSFPMTGKAAMNPKALFPNQNQIVNLNFKVTQNKDSFSSDLAMPFYQKAEVERALGDKKYLIEFSTKRGKKDDEVAIEMRLKHSKSKIVLMKKNFTAKLNEYSKIKSHGLNIDLRPEII